MKENIDYDFNFSESHCSYCCLSVFEQGELLSVKWSFESIWRDPGEAGFSTNQQECKWPTSYHIELQVYNTFFG